MGGSLRYPSHHMSPLVGEAGSPPIAMRAEKLTASARATSPTSPFLFSAACEQDSEAGVKPLEASSDGRSAWSSADSTKLYGVEGWGSPFFVVSEEGHLCVRPQGGKPWMLLTSTLSSSHQELLLLAS